MAELTGGAVTSRSKTGRCSATQSTSSRKLLVHHVSVSQAIRTTLVIKFGSGCVMSTGHSPPGFHPGRVVSPEDSKCEGADMQMPFQKRCICISTDCHLAVQPSFQIQMHMSIAYKRIDA